MKERIQTIKGRGTITHSARQASAAVRYHLEVWQERTGEGRLAGLEEIHGRIDPAPPWPLSTDLCTLQLEDGRKLKCFLTNLEGELTATGGFH